MTTTKDNECVEYHETTTLKCECCGGDAIFTEEGPNDEYSDILCEKCEAGENPSCRNCGDLS